MFILLLFDKFGAIQEVGKKGREKSFFVELRKKELVGSRKKLRVKTQLKLAQER